MQGFGGLWFVAVLLVQGSPQWASAYDKAPNTPNRIWGGLNAAHVRSSTDTGRHVPDTATTIVSLPDGVPTTQAKREPTHTLESNSTDGGETPFRNLTEGRGSETILEENVFMIKRDGSREVLEEQKVRL